MSVEQRELLMAVDDIAGVVDIQGVGKRDVSEKCRAGKLLLARFLDRLTGISGDGF